MSEYTAISSGALDYIANLQRELAEARAECARLREAFGVFIHAMEQYGYADPRWREAIIAANTALGEQHD